MEPDEQQRLARDRLANPEVSELEGLIALLIGGAAGFWGMVVLFSDSSYSTYGFWVYVLLVHVLPAAAMGALVPRYWYSAVLCAWGAVFLGGVGLRVMLQDTGTVSLMAWLTILVFPGVCLLGARVGAWARVGLEVRARDWFRTQFGGSGRG